MTQATDSTPCHALVVTLNSEQEKPEKGITELSKANENPKKSGAANPIPYNTHVSVSLDTTGMCAELFREEIEGL